MASFLKDTARVVAWALVGLETCVLVRFARLRGDGRAARKCLWAGARERKALLDGLVR